jgi:hypothetical protein
VTNLIVDLLHLDAEHQNVVLDERDGSVVTEFQSTETHGS